MPGMELSGFEPRIDQLSRKIQEIRERKEANLDTAMDGAMDVIEQNIGRQEAREAQMTLEGLGDELLIQQKAAAHSLSADKVAMLIADPFDD